MDQFRLKQNVIFQLDLWLLELGEIVKIFERIKIVLFKSLRNSKRRNKEILRRNLIQTR